MKIKLLGLIILASLLLSCSSGPIGVAKMEDRLSAYGAAIRWGEFEKAMDFQNPAHRTRLDDAWLKNIHVSSYNPLYRKEVEGSNIVEQKVEIRYFIEPFGVEKVLTDRQLWRFDEDKGKWMLETDLPVFR